MAELFERAPPGIVIALCGNKCDLEDRQVNREVDFADIGSPEIC